MMRLTRLGILALVLAGVTLSFDGSAASSAVQASGEPAAPPAPLSASADPAASALEPLSLLSFGMGLSLVGASLRRRLLKLEAAA